MRLGDSFDPIGVYSSIGDTTKGFVGIRGDGSVGNVGPPGGRVGAIAPEAAPLF